ncbi:MAG: hypothetical protein AB7O98_17510 [Hyphomonadaceae bacterium]
MSKSNPLSPYLNAPPTPKQLDRLTDAELRAIIKSAREVETLNTTDLDDTIQWARSCREAAEQMLAKRGGKP